MSNISVAEILKLHGKWIEGKPFASLVAEKRKVTARHAYNLIKEAWKNAEVLKIPLPNRKVLYGLAEFGAPVAGKIRERFSNEHLQSGEYSELAPENAETVAIIDFFLDNFIDKDNPNNQEFILMLKLLRDYHVRVGKARGR